MALTYEVDLTGMVEPRWPTAPLLAQAGMRAARFADRYRLPLEPLMDWRGLTDPEADLYAVTAGYHPAQIWEEWHLGALFYENNPTLDLTMVR